MRLRDLGKIWVLALAPRSRPLQAAPYAISGPHPSPAASPATVEEPRARTESRCANCSRATIADSAISVARGGVAIATRPRGIVASRCGPDLVVPHIHALAQLAAHGVPTPRARRPTRSAAHEMYCNHVCQARNTRLFSRQRLRSTDMPPPRPRSRARAPHVVPARRRYLRARAPRFGVGRASLSRAFTPHRGANRRHTDP